MPATITVFCVNNFNGSGLKQPSTVASGCTVGDLLNTQGVPSGTANLVLSVRPDGGAQAPATRSTVLSQGDTLIITVGGQKGNVS